VWKKDQPPQDYPVHPPDYTPGMQSGTPILRHTSSRLQCLSPYCNKISSIACPRQLCASDCRCAVGGPCTTHSVKAIKLKTMAPTSCPPQEGLSHHPTGSMHLLAPSLPSDDESTLAMSQVFMRVTIWLSQHVPKFNGWPKCRV
jgi:hypothetical protein